jgi:phosphoglycerate dehydrogenase-like enzyme
MKTKIAVLDDYQQVALKYADWANIQQQAQLDIYTDHIADDTAVIQRLKPYHILCVMRERTPLTKERLAKLPNLKLIISTGKRNASIDVTAAEELGIAVKFTDYTETGAPEMTWAVLMALARHITEENQNFRQGRWQTTIATDLSGKTLGIVGLGRVGTKVAAYAKAFDMNIIAWSQNLTAEKAAAAGAELVSKEELFKRADFISVHLVLSERTRHIIGTPSLELMKPTAYLINTSRGPLIDEDALVTILKTQRIAGAAVDVFDTEPLPGEHGLRTLPNLLGTPHIGYVTENTYRNFYEDTVVHLEEWLKK